MYDKYTFDRNAAASAIALINGKRQASALKSRRIDEEDESKLSWRERLWLNIGVKTMSEAEPTQKPFSFWNPTMITAWVSVIGLILLLVSLIAAGSWYLSAQHSKYEEMQRQIDKDRQEANQRMTQNEIDTKKAKEMQILNSRHPDEPETKEKK